MKWFMLSVLVALGGSLLLCVLVSKSLLVFLHFSVDVDHVVVPY